MFGVCFLAPSRAELNPLTPIFPRDPVVPSQVRWVSPHTAPPGFMSLLLNDWRIMEDLGVAFCTM